MAFVNAINIAFVYSWQLYRIISGKTLLQKNLRRHIVGIMIRQTKPRIINVGSRPTKAHKVVDEVRYNGLGHYPINFGNAFFMEKVLSGNFIWEA